MTARSEVNWAGATPDALPNREALEPTPAKFTANGRGSDNVVTSASVASSQARLVAAEASVASTGTGSTTNTGVRSHVNLSPIRSNLGARRSSFIGMGEGLLPNMGTRLPLPGAPSITGEAPAEGSAGNVAPSVRTGTSSITSSYAFGGDDLG
jgi:hypothetical protein